MLFSISAKVDVQPIPSATSGKSRAAPISARERSNNGPETKLVVFRQTCRKLIRSLFRRGRFQPTNRRNKNTGAQLSYVLLLCAGPDRHRLSRQPLPATVGEVLMLCACAASGTDCEQHTHGEFGCIRVVHPLLRLFQYVPILLANSFWTTGWLGVWWWGAPGQAPLPPTATRPFRPGIWLQMPGPYTHAGAAESGAMSAKPSIVPMWSQTLGILP